MPDSRRSLGGTAEDCGPRGGTTVHPNPGEQVIRWAASRSEQGLRALFRITLLLAVLTKGVGAWKMPPGDRSDDGKPGHENPIGRRLDGYGYYFNPGIPAGENPTGHPTGCCS